MGPDDSVVYPSLPPQDYLGGLGEGYLGSLLESVYLTTIRSNFEGYPVVISFESNLFGRTFEWFYIRFRFYQIL